MALVLVVLVVSDIQALAVLVQASGLVEVAYMGRALEVCRTQAQVCYRAWYARGRVSGGQGDAAVY